MFERSEFGARPRLAEHRREPREAGRVIGARGILKGRREAPLKCPSGHT